MMKKTIYIEGMACVHCKNSVETALKNLSGVNTAVVDLDKKCAIIESETEIDNAVLTATVTEIGFEVEKIV